MCKLLERPVWVSGMLRTVGVRGGGVHAGKGDALSGKGREGKGRSKDGKKLSFVSVLYHV